MRRGRALPCLQRRARPCLSCAKAQRHATLCYRFCQRPSGGCFSDLPFSLLTGIRLCRRRLEPPPPASSSGKKRSPSALFFSAFQHRVKMATDGATNGPEVSKGGPKGSKMEAKWSTGTSPSRSGTVPDRNGPTCVPTYYLLYKSHSGHPPK